MATIKVQCVCGQRYSFDVESGVERLPAPVQCPVCGVDGTAVANEQLRALRVAEVSPAAKLRFAMSVPTEAPPILDRGATPARPDRALPTVPVFEGRGMASNPGRLRVNWGRVFSTHRLAFVILMIIAFMGVALGIVIHPSMLIFTAAGFWLMFSKSYMTRAKFISGDVCPGIIVSESPPLIAVMTNMSAVGGTNPAVRVIRQRLAGMTGGPAVQGMRVATVAHYLRPITNGVWKDFDPEVINCCVTDEVEVQRVFDTIREEDWQALERAIEHLPLRSVGLHRLSTAPPVLRGPPPLSRGVPGGFSVAPARARGGSSSTPSWRNAGVVLAVILTIIVTVARRWPQIQKMREKQHSTQPNARDLLPQALPRGGGFERAAPPVFQPQPAGARPSPPQMSGPRGIPGRPGSNPGEKVEVLWGATWFPATVVRTEGVRTLIHYDGYATNSDEWVTPGRIRPVR